MQDINFEVVKLFGATVRGMTAGAGLNGQTTSISVELIEDLDAGDSYQAPQIGSPVNFVYNTFNYSGCVQHQNEQDSTEGYPVYEVIIQDFRELLAGVPVIVAGYKDAVSGVPNVLNAYGYWENALGFGGALVNESGMVYSSPLNVISTGFAADGGGITLTLNPEGNVGIGPAIEYLTKNAGAYGGPVNFFGYKYAIDLSGLPTAVPYYRMGGTALSVLDVVNQLCADAGYDFYCTLNLSTMTIGFKSVSRLAQPILGQISRFVNSLSDDIVISKSFGTELRNDVTNAILIGGAQQQLSLQQVSPGSAAIQPFWGFDYLGNAVVGQGNPTVEQTALVDCTSIIDIMGTNYYSLTITECRFALADFDSWAAYVLRYDPDKAEVINLVCAIDAESDFAELFGIDGFFSRDMITQDDEALKLFGQVNQIEYWTRRAQRVYEFVNNYATQFYGRKFMVQIPYYLYWKVEPETTHVISSDEVSDGGFLQSGSQPLGLNFLNEDTFLLPDGRFQCFVRFTSPTDVDLEKLNAEDCVIQGSTLYSKASINSDYGIFYLANSLYPYVVVELNNPVYQLAPDVLGGIPELSYLLGLDSEAVLDSALNERQGSFPVRVGPSAFIFDGCALPMKSNRVSYGPWATGTFGPSGPAGKVDFKQDDSFVPWNFGDLNTLNLAAAAQITNVATQQQVIETATVELAEFPRCTIGDVLVVGGPNVTGLSLSLGANGYRTTYTLQTYTPKKYAFAQANADRLRRDGLAAADLRKQIRRLNQRQQLIAQAEYQAEFGFMRNASPGVIQRSPKEVIVSHTKNTAQNGFRTRSAFCDTREAFANIRTDDPTRYPDYSMVSSEALFRGFSTALTDDSSPPNLPHYQIERPQLNPYAIPSRTTLDQYDDNLRGCDVDFIASGDIYQGSLSRFRNVAPGPDPNRSGAIDYNSARPVGFTLPNTAIGYGYTNLSKPVPNMTVITYDDNGNPSIPQHQWSENFATNPGLLANQRKAGPMDFCWDDWRGVWMSGRYPLRGILQANGVSPTNGVMMSVRVDGTTYLQDQVTVYVDAEFTSSSLTMGTFCVATYSPLSDKWMITSASCPS